MVNIANKTIKDYITNLNESDQKKLKTLLSSDTNKLKENYDSLKDKIISKLEKLQEDDNDEEVIKRIDETIEKISTESFDTLNYIKLQQLNENL
jgi:hypothetical protein